MAAAPRRSADPPKQAPPADDAVRRRWVRGAFILAVISMSTYLLVLNFYKMSNNDIWIHLKTGEWILQNGWVPGNDMYSFNATHRPYIAFEWLAGILFYFAYEAAGVPGLILFKIALVGVMWWFLYDTARLLRARLSVILPGLAILIYISTARFLVRPHILSYLFLALYIWLFFNYRERGRDRRWLYAILPAQVLWINLHGAWPTGILLVTTFTLGEGLIYLRAKKFRIGRESAISSRDMSLLAGLIPASIVVNFINPYGWKLITFPFEVFAMKIYMTGIYEWKPPYSRAYHSSTMFFFYLLHLALLCAGFFLAHREKKRSRASGEMISFLNNALVVILVLFFLILAFWWLQDPATNWNPQNLKYALYFLFGLFCFFTVLNYKTVDFTQAGIFGLLFLLSVRHNRNVTDAAIGTFPVMAAAVSLAVGRLTQPKSPRRPARSRQKEEAAAPEEAGAGFFRRLPPDPSSPLAVVAGSFLLLGISLHAAIFSYYFDFRGGGREKGLAVANNMPICGVNFIEKNNITGKAFVSYPYASPLIHRMYPAVKVNMDSRNGHVYGEKIYADYLRTLRTPSMMKEYLEQNDIDFFFLSHGDRNSAVFRDVQASGEWAPVYLDTRGFILLKRKPEHADIIAREEFRHIRPSAWGTTPVNTSNALEVLAEAENGIASCPTSSFSYFYKMRAQTVLGQFEEAIATGHRILQIQPGNAQVHVFVGSVYEKINRQIEAMEMYDKALAINPKLKGARDSLQRLRGF
jgi:hypothetical protein